jgi:hypothetical protein
MKKCYLFLIVLISLSLKLHSQNMQDVVYLKNGSIIRGIIIEQVPNQSIKIETKDKSVFVFKTEEVDKIEKEELPDVQNRVSETPTKIPNVNVNDYGSHFSIGISLGGGGIIGIPIKVFMHRNIAFEADVHFHPVIFLKKTIVSSNYSSSSNLDVSFYPNVLLTGKFDFYFSRKYIPNKRVRLSGMFIQGGYSYGSRFDGYMGALGWQYERFKINHKNNSLSFGLGAGIMVLDDKEARPHYTGGWYGHYETPQEYYYNPMIYWKVAWHFFIRTKK